MFLWKIFLKIALIKLNIKDPIIWLSRPEMVDYIGKFNERFIIYHVVDEYLAYEGVNKKQRKEIWNKEKVLLKKADLVIVVSKNLLESKKRFNKNTYLVPNAVDFESYSKSLSFIKKLPADIAKLKKPLIGYSGRIGSKLDFNLLYDMADSHPEWSLVFVGVVDNRYCEESIEMMKSLKNVYFLGFKNIGILAEYINAFDICILPYLINEHSKNINPLKLYDYLALGKPIVATDIVEVHNFKEVVKIALSKEEFICHIKEALNENNANLMQKRILLASQNTWDDRIKQINELINLKLNVSKSQPSK
jgi:glycosyltransferase involved in cell wall biosynthesis